jgi:hypothetical protein
MLIFVVHEMILFLNITSMLACEIHGIILFFNIVEKFILKYYLENLFLNSTLNC